MTAADPYRPNVGIALFDRGGRVFIARRTGDDGPEIIFPGHEWQMPQGGVEPGEDLEPAARRELAEETGIRSVALLGRMAEAVTYDWPPYHGPPHRLARWRGQRQVWFAYRLTGSEAEIDLAASAGTEPIEFDAWRWEALASLPDLVVPYKRPLYAAVVEAFAAFAMPAE